MANLLSVNGIDEEEILVTVSTSLYNVIDHDLLKQAFIQINRLPKVPKLLLQVYKEDYPVAVFKDRIQTVRNLKEETKLDPDNRHRIHVAYEPGQSYRIGNSVGKVFATNAGLILLNDVRLKQVAGDPPDPIYFVNLVIHEILHIYGLDHASGLGVLVRNGSVMNLGKFGFVGLSHDDKMGLLEYYESPKRKRVEVIIEATGVNVGLLNRDKKKFSQGKNIEDGKAVFTHVKKGRYSIYINGNKVKNFKANKDKTIILN